ncbi:MAG: aminopeptidase [Chloroflexota bacterium]
MADVRVEKFAQILVDHSAEIKPGDRVAIEATTAAAPLVRTLCATILKRGGYPHLLLDLPDQEEIMFANASDEQLDFTPTFRKLAYDQFESRIRIQSLTNPRALTNVDPARQKRHQKAISPILETQMRRGADRSFKWVSTLFPTEGYAMEAEMSLANFEDFVYRACHANDADPVAYWKKVETSQNKIIERIEGHDKVALKGPNVDLSLSIKGRKFINAAGLNNMPDGEIFSGPVENSLNGWVRFTYPAIYIGVLVEGVELTFKDGKVTQAKADKNLPFLMEMLDSDPGARYVGEFAIGTNYEIDRFSHNILFDEKLGGSFHMALGAGYPETGSTNKSLIHWDMICGMKEDAEIILDGDVVYKNGQFTI